VDRAVARKGGSRRSDKARKKAPGPAPNSEDRSWRLPLVLAVVLTAVMCAVVLLRVPIGVAGEWVWAYALAPNWPNLVWAIACGGAFLLVFHLGLQVFAKQGEWSRRALIAILLFGVFIVHLAVASLGQYGLMEDAWVILSPWETGAYFHEAERLELGTLSAAPGLTDPVRYVDEFDEYIDRDWKQYGDVSNTRLNVHPPGNTLSFYAVKRGVQAWPLVGKVAVNAALAGSAPLREQFQDEEFSAAVTPIAPGIFTATFLFQFLSCLVLVPAMVLSRHLAPKQLPLCAGALAAFIPSVFLFEPSPDQSYALVAVFLLLFVYLALSKKSSLWAFLAGATAYCGLFFSLAYLVIGAIAAACVLFALVSQASPVQYLRSNWRTVGRIVAFGLAGLAVPAVVMRLVLGYDTVRVLALCWRNHADFYTWEEFPRTYWKWLLINPFELLMFAGGSVSALTVAAVVREWRKPRLGFRKNLNPYLWGLLLVIVILWISGKNSGEAARLWMPLMPALAIVGLSAYGESRWPNWVYTVLLGLQMLQIIVFRLSFDVYRVAQHITGKTFG